VHDRKRQDMKDNKDKLVYSELTKIILGCCFDVINELGSGFLESVYKNALIIAMREKELHVQVEKRFEVTFHKQRIGVYIADLIVNEKVIIELKCCEYLLPEHQAQLINYLKVSGLQIGLLVNFGKRKLDYKRLYHPNYPAACDLAHLVFS
jgi:GxxExxY protein